jgi:hypothetical protein
MLEIDWFLNCGGEGCGRFGVESHDIIRRHGNVDLVGGVGSGPIPDRLYLEPMKKSNRYGNKIGSRL